MANQTIKPGTILEATSVCDSNCKWEASVTERNGSFIKANLPGYGVIRKKVKISYDGTEYVMLLGSYSMAPIFKIKTTTI